MASTVRPAAPADWSTAPGALRIASRPYRPHASRLGVISRSACRPQAQWLKIVRAGRPAPRAGTLAGIGEGSDIEAQHRAAANSRVKSRESREGPCSAAPNPVSRPLADGTLTRRGFLMINAAFFGAIAAAGSSQPPELPDLPYRGQYYGCGFAGPGGAANTHHRSATDEAISQFFFAERSGSIDQISWQVRRSTDEGYSGGDGGTYTIEIRTANANTKRAIPINQGGN